MNATEIKQKITDGKKSFLKKRARKILTLSGMLFIVSSKNKNNEKMLYIFYNDRENNTNQRVSKKYAEAKANVETSNNNNLKIFFKSICNANFGKIQFSEGNDVAYYYFSNNKLEFTSGKGTMKSILEIFMVIK